MTSPYHDLGDLIHDENPYGDGKLPTGLDALAQAERQRWGIAAPNEPAPAQGLSATVPAAAGHPNIPDLVMDGLAKAVTKAEGAGQRLNLEFLEKIDEVDTLFWEFNDEKPFKNGFGYRITKAMKIKYTFVLPQSALKPAERPNFPNGKEITTYLLIGYSGPNGD